MPWPAPHLRGWLCRLGAPDHAYLFVFHGDGTIELAYGGMSGSGSRTQTIQLLRRTSTTTLQ